MKLVIDIDEDVYKLFTGNGQGMKVVRFNLENTLKNGIPLEKELKKIRTKIDALPTMSCNDIGCSYMWAKDYKIDVLSILDKSIEEKE